MTVITKGSESATILQWSLGCLWGAITVIVVNSPVLGKCALSSLERIIGTTVGGWIGYACYLEISQHKRVFLPLVSVIYAFAAAVVGSVLGVAGAANLSTITLLSVLWAAPTSAALPLVGVRIGCISAAIFVVTFLSIFIYPQVASEQTIDSLRRAMMALSKLNHDVWEEVKEICSEHHELLKKNHDPATCGTAGHHRLESTVCVCANAAKDPGAPSSCLPKEPNGNVSELEAEAGKSSRWSPFAFLGGRRRARVRRKQALELQMGPLMEDNGKERSMCATLAEVRTCLAEVPEHMRWALNEVYLGSFFGRRWYLPNTSIYARYLDRASWHMPEQAIKQVAMRLNRCMRLLYTIHFTLKEGFRDEVMLAMDHLLPVKILIDLATTALPIMEDLTCCLPEPGKSGPNPETNTTEHLAKLKLVVRDLVALSKCSFSQKVRLTMLGARAEGSRRIEEVLSLFPEKDWGADPPPQEGPPPIRWCTTCPNTHELFLFPDTPAGYLAQMRWYSFHFLMEALVDTYEKLHTALSITSQLLPGAPLLGPIQDVPQKFDV
ncbi:g2143 [Coccomyxa elongata]